MPDDPRSTHIPSKRAGRFEWMDTLRGTAILLMLLWHATSIPTLTSGIPIPAPLLALNDFFLPFRMPTLMFLSGMLLARSLRKPLPEYYWGKARLLLWPYLVWVAVIRLIDDSAWMLVHPTTYIATAYLWFLFYVSVYYAIAPLVVRMPRWLVPLAFLAGSAVVEQWQFHRLLYFAFFFFSGHFASAFSAQMESMLRRRAIVWTFGLVAMSLGLVSATTNIAYVPYFAPMSLTGILVGIRIAQRLTSKVTAPVRAVGRTSIIYYTSHYPVMVTVLSLALAIGITYPGVSLVLLASGILTGALLSRYRSVRPITWLFEAPVPAQFPSLSRAASVINLRSPRGSARIAVRPARPPD